MIPSWPTHQSLNRPSQRWPSAPWTVATFLCCWFISLKREIFFWIWKVTNWRPPALNISIKHLLLLKLFWIKFYIRTWCLRTCHWHLVKSTACVYISGPLEICSQKEIGNCCKSRKSDLRPLGSLQCSGVIGWTQSHIINTAEAHRQTFIHGYAQLHRFTQVLNSIRERKLGSGAFYSTWQLEHRAR